MSVMAPGGVDSVGRPIRGRRPAFPWPFVALLVAGAAVEFGLLAAWQRNGYWDFSDGVYAESARAFLHGLVPYRAFAAAQPPPVYLAGAFLLAVHDGLASLRAGMALVDFLTAVLVGVSVWRLCRRRWIAVAAAGIAPLLPISLHEHAQLMPETLAAPLLLAGALFCARPGRTMIGGLLLALAAISKLAFVVPALAVALVAPKRGRAVLILVVASAALAAASLAVFGTGVWREAVEAQLQVGRVTLHSAAGLLAQAVWSELALMIGAAMAVVIWFVEPEAVAEPALLRTLAAAAGAGLALAATVVKRGSYVNVLVVAEPALLALAACGATWCWQRHRVWRPLVVGLGALLLTQSLSLLTSPGNPWAAKRPGARSGLAWTASPASVNQAVSTARRCPKGVAYSGDPYFAFLAGRRMPGNQPDLFMLQYARADSRFAQRAARDQPRCPAT